MCIRDSSPGVVRVLFLLLSLGGCRVHLYPASLAHVRMRVKRCCAPWREMPSWAPMTDQVAPVWRALVTAAARVASAARACWWAVATQPRTSNGRPAGSGTGVWPLPRVERVALQDAHNATAPTRMVAVRVQRGRRAGSSA